MIRENEIMDVLGNNIPGINHELEKTPNPSNIYKAVYCFARFTSTRIQKGDFNEVKNCFGMAEKLWKEGNQTIKNAIENVFIFSISAAIDLACAKKINFKLMLCPELRHEFNRQTAACG